MNKTYYIMRLETIVTLKILIQLLIEDMGTSNCITFYGIPINKIKDIHNELHEISNEFNNIHSDK